MKKVYSSGGGFSIHSSVGAPKSEDWQRVREGVAALEGDVATQVAARIAAASADGRITKEEYLSKDRFSIGGFGIARKDASIQGAMKEDVTAFGLRAGKVDSFDVAALRGLLAREELRLDPEVRADLVAKVQAYEAELKAGKIATGTYLDARGQIHELTEGRIEVPYERFIETLPPEDWSPNLPRYQGGEVRQIERETLPDGTRRVLQQERMSLDSWPNNLDMTKNSIVEIGPDRARVSWHVFHSDPTALTMYGRSVLRDDGHIDFTKTEDGKVLVRCHSAHEISTPGTKLARAFLGKQLTGQIAGQAGLGPFFAATIERYRGIGLGEIEGRKLPRGGEG